jgi:hypothetical protein
MNRTQQRCRLIRKWRKEIIDRLIPWFPTTYFRTRRKQALAFLQRVVGLEESGAFAGGSACGGGAEEVG